MDFVEDLFGPETDSDRLAERNLLHEEEWLARLVEMRRSSGLTQAQVGEQMGISQSGVARIEAGDRDLHLSSLRRYAIAVGAEVRHIVNPARAGITMDIESEQFSPVHDVPRSSRSLQRVSYSVGA